MVRNIDDLEFTLSSHPQTMLDGLRALRTNPHFCDVTLIVGGREFPCHRGILALCSHYFHSMFCGDFVESICAKVEIKDVDPIIMETLLDFAYTGKLTINQGNVEGLIRTSNQLHFPTVRKVCSRYLQQQMDPTNCLGIWDFGERYGCPEVTAKAWTFLQENFEAVSQQEEFLLLPKRRLAIYLSSKLLQVSEEQCLAEAVLWWVRYDVAARAADLPELLELAHLPSLADQYLQNLLSSEPLIQDSERCQTVISQCRRLGETESVGLRTSPTHPQMLQEVLVVVGGRALDETEEEDQGNEPPPITNNCTFYNPKTKQWLSLPDFPDYNKWGFSVVALNNDVYITGGSRGSHTDTWSTTQCWCFLLKEGKWKPITPMRRPRTNHASAILNGEIYAIGGTLLDTVEVECYDPYSDGWALISPALKYVSNFSATGCLGKLYLIGSCAMKYNALTMQCYNPVIDGWSVIASPFIPKYLSGPRCTALHGLIYLIGDNTKKVYVYDPQVNLWQKELQILTIRNTLNTSSYLNNTPNYLLGPERQCTSHLQLHVTNCRQLQVQLLHSLHENGGMVTLGGKLYLSGGHWKGMAGDYQVEMEVYDSSMDQWNREASMPCLWLYHGTTTIFMDVSQWNEPFLGQQVP